MELKEGVRFKVVKIILGVILISPKETLYILNWAILISKCTCETQDDMMSKAIAPKCRMTSV